MQKVVAKVGFTRHVVNEFEKEVNALLEQGWHLDLFEVEKAGFFRIICTAILCDEEHWDESSYYGESSSEEYFDPDEPIDPVPQKEKDFKKNEFKHEDLLVKDDFPRKR